MLELVRRQRPLQQVRRRTSNNPTTENLIGAAPRRLGAAFFVRILGSAMF